MEVTGCISIWVKNLANVANMAGWARRKGATGAGRAPARTSQSACFIRPSASSLKT